VILGTDNKVLEIAPNGVQADGNIESIWIRVYLSWVGKPARILFI